MKDMNLKKKLFPVLTGTALSTSLAVPVLASESSSLSTIESALTTSFTEIGTSATGMIGKILPIALPVIGGVLIVMLGLKIFKRITNKV